MKKLSLLVLFCSLIAFSCSKEEENPTTELENLQLNLIEDQTIIEVPQALLESENIYAMQAAGWIEMANAFKTSYSSFFTAPSGAVKTSNPITPSNARMAAGTQYLVYTWTYGGNSIAYQIHATADKYIFEVLMKLDNGPWQLFLYADEAKDKKSGSVKIYDAYDTGLLSWTYNWQVVGDTFKWTMFNPEGEKIALEVSQVTGAGKMEYYINNSSLQSKIIWDAQGNGSWTYYSDGETLTGTWTA